ncbi:hypothetical protein RB3394 [Rhodopirellula baltica SH 1]|uniref:Uncharacterized protein n=1 Tax=Rhodopirellula baltica (strain DSM 10527 / NCIMB 13988 / SH1) TaxID=243090 RepID=Q7UUB5_RHOBA|nr:hypothetical protein RB3394 [Rhodopirellula baltica SH 1]
MKVTLCCLTYCVLLAFERFRSRTSFGFSFFSRILNL